VHLEESRCQFRPFNDRRLSKTRAYLLEVPLPKALRKSRKIVDTACT